MEKGISSTAARQEQICTWEGAKLAAAEAQRGDGGNETEAVREGGRQVGPV